MISQPEAMTCSRANVIETDVLLLAFADIRLKWRLVANLCVYNSTCIFEETLPKVVENLSICCLIYKKSIFSLTKAH